MPDATPDPVHHLQCTEVWGGNRTVDDRVVLPGLDAWVFSKPHGGGRGGDVHYVSSCAAGHIARVLVADVAGHGQGVARMAGRLQRLMRRHVSDRDLRRLVRSLNREFAALATGGLFATAVAMTFEARSRRLLLANAGHPAPLLYRAAAGEWSYLEPVGDFDKPARDGSVANLPLGIFDAVDYRQVSLRLDPGDLVVCYTDSLPESRDAAGAMLGTAGVLGAVRGLARGGDFAGWVGTFRALLGTIAATSDDDVTALVLQPNGLRERVPVADFLRAPFRLARAVLGSYLPGAARPAPSDRAI